MTKIHLNYDGNQNNGIIFNDTYINGALFTGEHLKPELSFDYDSFQFSEVFDNSNGIELNGKTFELSDEQKVEIKELAIEWVQEVGQEGNPSDEQLDSVEMQEAMDYLEATDWYTSRFYELGIAIPTAVSEERAVKRIIIEDYNTKY